MIREGKEMERLMKYLKWAAWISVLMLLVYSYVRTVPIDEQAFEQYESFDSYEQIKSNPIIYRVSADGENVGYLAFGEAYGYQSTIMAGVVVGDQGAVKEVRIIDQNETPSFIQKIYNSEFLDNEFPSILIADGFSTEINVQAVSGATVSSSAITKAVAEASSIIGDNYLAMRVPSKTGVKFGTTEFVLLGMLLLTFLSYKLKNQKLRYLTMAYSIVLLGFKYKQFIAFSWIVSLFTGKVPDFSANVGWYILVGGTILFIAVTGKNIYCTYICPFGAMQQAEKKLAGFDFFKVSPKLKQYLRAVPPILAYIGFVVAIVNEQMGALSYEPFSLLYGRTGVGVQWALLPLVLIMSLLVMGFYCHHACPIGFLLTQGVKLRKKVASLLSKTGENKPAVVEKTINNKKQVIHWNIADILMSITVVAMTGITLMTIFGNI